jgi:type V secretory pathway adhesin AidA
VEALIKAKHKIQPKFGLGYHHIDTFDEREDLVNTNITHCFTISITTGDEAGYSCRPRR